MAPMRKARQPVRRIKGKGAYNVDSSYKKTKRARKVAKKLPNYEPSIGRSLLTEGGSLLGGVFGMPGLGKAAGSALSNVFGLGSYEIKDNVFMEGRLPTMTNIPAGGGTVIRYQEYLGDLITSATPGAFAINSWLINAANRESFPFLAQLAVNYESFSIEGLIYEFRSTSASALNSTNTALGSVILATQYDVAEAPFTSKAEMLNYEYSNSVKPSDNCMHMIECSPSQTNLPILYTLDGLNPANTDARLYHLGRFSAATIGFQAASVRIGEIHCTYQIRLLKPKLYSALGLDDDFFQMNNVAYTNATPLGNTATRIINVNNFGVVPGTANLSIPGSALVKSYRFEVEWSGAVTALFSPPSITVSTNASFVNTLSSPNTGVSTFVAMQHGVIKTIGDSLAVNIAWGTVGVLPASGLLVTVRLMEVPNVD